VAAFYFPPQLPALYDEAGCPASAVREPSPAVAEIGGEDVSIKTSTRLVKNVLIVDTIGELRLGEGTDVVRNLIREQLEQGYKNILLNLRDVRHIDSAGVGELMSCYTSVRNQGGQLKLMNLSKNVHNLLQITKLYTIFEVVEDEETAVASYS
jgi:anti-sigma B factor antagonist